MNLKRQAGITNLQTLLPAEPRSPGTHGNLLSGLAPGLHHSNARKLQPPDVTFPADSGEKTLLNSVFHLFPFFCLSTWHSAYVFSSLSFPFAFMPAFEKISMCITTDSSILSHLRLQLSL